MRMSRALVPTLRDPPSDADTPGHRLLVRGGFVRPMAQGLFHLLPLGLRVQRRIEGILREEMDGIGAQEVSLPLVQPSELWEQSGRLGSVGSELVRAPLPGRSDPGAGIRDEGRLLLPRRPGLPGCVL